MCYDGQKVILVSIGKEPKEQKNILLLKLVKIYDFSKYTLVHAHEVGIVGINLLTKVYKALLFLALKETIQPYAVRQFVVFMLLIRFSGVSLKPYAPMESSLFLL